MTDSALSTPRRTPPRGWNSWDSYGTAVTEAEVMRNAEFIAAQLLPHGWDTVVVDIQWYEPNARAGGYNDDAAVVLDGWGRPQPTENRFPSAAGGKGFAPLAARIHALGLRFGLHIMRGIPRVAVAERLSVLGTEWTAADIADQAAPCTWNSDNWGLDHEHPGAAAYYRSLAALFAEWGVDFVKADDMLSPYRDRDIEALSAALAAASSETGRPIELSLSPGVDLSTEHAAHLAEHANAWRVSNDLWDEWPDVVDMFPRMARWAQFSAPGAWPDADMLPLGHIGIRAERGGDRMSRLTLDEQRTLMTLWTMTHSPLFFGGDLPTSPSETIALLRNDAVLEVHTWSTGYREVLREGDLIVWTAQLGDRRIAAVFWLGGDTKRIELPLASLGATDAVVARELWSGRAVPLAGGSLTVELAAHDAAMIELALR